MKAVAGTKLKEASAAGVLGLHRPGVGFTTSVTDWPAEVPYPNANLEM